MFIFKNQQESAQKFRNLLTETSK